MNANILHILSKRLKDQFVQEWYETLCNQPKLNNFILFKTDFKYEKYIKIINNGNHRKQLTKFRLSSHCLEVEVGIFKI